MKSLSWEQQFIQNYWMGLGDTSKIVTPDPFAGRSEYELSHPDEFLLDLMRRPENFGFTARVVFNKTLAPFQLAILWELWRHPFPMLIGSRGMGKCAAGDTLIMTGDGIRRLGEVASGEPEHVRNEVPGLRMLGESGFKDVEYAWDNGEGNTLVIETEMGYRVEVTPNHPLRVAAGGGVVWKDAGDLRPGDGMVIDLSRQWYEPSYDLGESTAGELGLGWVAGGHLPAGLLSSPRPTVAAFLRGLFSRSAINGEGGELALGGLSERTAREIQFLLSRFGVASRVAAAGTDFGIEVSGPSLRSFADEVGLDGPAGDSLASAAADLGPEKERIVDPLRSITPGRARTYDVHVPDGHSFVTNGLVSHNSFLLALYGMFRLLFCPGSRVVVVGSAFRQAKVIFDYCQELWDNSPVLRDIVGPDRRNGPKRDVDRCSLRMGDSVLLAIPIGDGCLRGDTAVTYADGFGRVDDGADLPVRVRDRMVWSPSERALVRSDECYANGVRPTKIVTTRLGLEVEGTHNHKLRVLDGLEVVWRRLDQLKPGDRLLVDRSRRWHDAPEECSEAESYALGLMVGDGCWTSPYKLGFASHDRELVEALERGTGFPFTPAADGDHFNHYGKQDRRSWLERWEMGHARALDKRMPPPLLRASRAAMSAFLRGLYDTDGHVFVGKDKGGISVGLTNTSETLVRQVQYVLLHYGVVSVLMRRKRNERWSECFELLITGSDVGLFAREIGFGLARKQGRLADALAAAKRPGSRGDEVPGVREEMSRVARSNKRARGSGGKPAFGPSELASRKTIAHEYARGFLSEYAECGDPFLDALAKLADPDVYYDEVVSVADGECETFDMHVPVSHEYGAGGFFSHNSKVRGLRANILLCDEFASVNKDIFERVIRGFGAVSLSPVEKLRQDAQVAAIKELGMWTDAHQELREETSTSNQTVISGTAYYAFNHFHDYWKQYRDIIDSKGEPRRLAEIFGGEVPADLNWKDYCVIRVPSEILPEGFMDKKQLAHARATVHIGTYQMEYCACVHPDTLILTDCGARPVSEVQPGERVLTHRGRFRPVLRRTCRPAPGPTISFRTYGGYGETVATSDHHFWTGSDWEPLGGLVGGTSMATLKELGGKKSIDVREYVDDWMECGDRIYPRHSQSRFSRDELAAIRSSGLSLSELARQYGATPATIDYVVRRQRRPKNAIPAVIELDYDFGLVVGYYASEGSRGANGRAVSFALDGHADATLESYVRQLSAACERVFGFAPKVYHKQDNVASVTINQRLVGGLLARICPGVSHTKFIDPEVLYSNENFLRGFVIGYWNGDGHRSAENVVAVATCVNLNLLCQIRTAISYFGVASSLYPIAGENHAEFRGRRYQCRPAYTLRMSGDNARAFGRIFYGEAGEIGRRRTLVRLEGGELKFPFREKKSSDYRGMVYNLEVDEDHSYSLLNATVHNCFSSDSNGFYKRSLVESCVCGKDDSPVHHASCGEVRFSAVLRGDPSRRYVMACDPASERDNFSLVVLELWPDHRRIVYCWTTTRARFKAKAKAGLAAEEDFYHHAAGKIRSLLALFPCERIAIDSQGGGVSIMEALQDGSRLAPGERKVLPVIDPDSPRDSDGMAGEHIIEVVNFARADWVRDANHGMRKDFEDKTLLFPEFDQAILALSLEEDERTGRVRVDPGDSSFERLYDTLEDCVLEIEELKDELATIEHGQHGSGRDYWDTPEVREAGNKKGRMRKDRYSALLMANMTARCLERAVRSEARQALGGFARDLANDKNQGSGPMWVAAGAEGAYWAERARQEFGDGSNYGGVARRGRGRPPV